MADLHVDLPDSTRSYIDEQVATCGYKDVSEYIRDLVEGDRKRAVRQRIDSLLREGIESGEPIPVNSGWWESRRQELEQRHLKGELS
ncbi:MAG: type II toxin-antitoxin system ParD family antitoxin [Pirellulaceae bacterium]